MVRRRPRGRLELTWMGKDAALIATEDGKYDYAWVDPDDPRVREVKTIDVIDIVASTLDEPDEKATSDNLLIIGDSGDALRSLGTVPEWADKYLGKVKLVYIDPPFNTSQTFEHYADQLEHSIWLTMMRDRIRDIKPLLAADASIWVHLDDVEVHRMRLVLDEELGADAFVAEMRWQKIPTRDNRTTISKSDDTLLVYAPSGSAWRYTRNLITRTADQIAGMYGNLDNDPRGLWTSDNLTAKAGPGRRAAQFWPMELPSGKVIDPPPGRCWLYTKERFDELVLDNRIWFGDGTRVPRLKRFLSEVQEGLVPTTWWTYEEVGSNDTAKKEILALFPDATPFSTPKPERLLERIIHIGSNPGDIVMDCFAGSGTTAAVAQKMGRRWVTVELQEATVDAFTRPRLDRVVNGDDPGGITTMSERVAVDGLPDGMTPKDAQQFNSLLSKAAKAVDGLNEDALKALRTATKTRDVRTVQWTGGGGFQVARMGPSMYEVDDASGEVFLSPAATNGAWSRAVAGQLKFTRTPDDPVFCGRKGRQRLAVVDGVVDENVIRTIVSSLADKQSAVVVGKAFVTGAAELLRELSPASVVRKAPDDLFPTRTRK